MSIDDELADLRRRVSRLETVIDASVPILAEIRDLLNDRLGGIERHLESMDLRLGRIEALLRDRPTDGHN